MKADYIEAMTQALEALENSVDLVREYAYEAERLYGKYPTRQGKVNGLKVIADDHEKVIAILREKLTEQPALRPCRSPYCECSVGQCSHPGFYDARGEPLPPAPPPECQTDAEKTAFAFDWWKALESGRQQPAQQQEPDADKHQAFIDSLPSDMDDKMFEQIHHWARQSYARHQRSTRGQMITAADSSDNHIIWAALRWAKENATTPQPARQQEPVRLRRGDILRCIETDELCTVWSTSTTGKTLVKWNANEFGAYTAEQIGELFWLEPEPDDLELAAENSDNYAAFHAGYRFAVAHSLAEQPAQQERVSRCMEHGECFGGECIYTSPPAQPSKTWVGLTDEEIIDHFRTNVGTGSLLSFADGVRYAEAKLREKNT